MATIIQVLLPVIFVAFVEADVGFHIPFFNFPDVPPLKPHDADMRPYNRPNNYNLAWSQSAASSEENDYPDDRYRPYQNYDPYYPKDAYYDNYGPGDYPGRHNEGYNRPRYEPPRRHQSPPVDKRRPNQKGFHVTSTEKTPIKMPSKDRKPITSAINIKNRIDNQHQRIKNKVEEPPPKSNEIIKNDVPKEQGEKEKQQVDLSKKKDYLLVNGNKMYILQENSLNPNTGIGNNANTLPSNVVYSGQPNNQIYQIVNGQPIATNQLSQDKISSGQPTINTPNSGYVTIYSNGQLIKIPGVVVSQNNEPVQNVAPIQGTNYMVANTVNTVPTNTQNVAVQNPATPLYFAAIPNQGSNTPIVVQMPNCACNSNVPPPVQTTSGNINGNNVVEQQYKQPVVEKEPAAPIQEGNGSPNPGTEIQNGKPLTVVPSVLNNLNLSNIGMPAVMMTGFKDKIVPHIEKKMPIKEDKQIAVPQLERKMPAKDDKEKILPQLENNMPIKDGKEKIIPRLENKMPIKDDKENIVPQPEKIIKPIKDDKEKIVPQPEKIIKPIKDDKEKIVPQIGRNMLIKEKKDKEDIDKKK